ncbi:hypothetical protein, partial [Chryseobacterium arthrosphaerae]|uniref:hypothetical protein n=1 Tax=Chryseobacterium arthrosphaerae TaxID=651561 RepID=UPI001F4A12FE
PVFILFLKILYHNDKGFFCFISQEVLIGLLYFFSSSSYFSKPLNSLSPFSETLNLTLLLFY